LLRKSNPKEIDASTRSPFGRTTCCEKRAELGAKMQVATEIRVSVSGYGRQVHQLTTGRINLGSLVYDHKIREATFIGDGERWILKQEKPTLSSPLTRHYKLYQEEKVILSASRTGPGFMVAFEYEKHPASLVRKSYTPPSYQLLVDNRVMLMIKKPGLLKRDAILEIMSPVDLLLVVFSYFIVATHWRLVRLQATRQ